jgi:hypothetical protein
VHDVGTFVWVVLVVIGVISSIVSNARRRVSVSPAHAVQPQAVRTSAVSAQAMAARPVPVSAPVPAPAVQTTQIRRPPPPPRVAAQPELGLEAFQAARRRAPRFFAGRGTLVRAVIAAELLGKPLALRDGP